MNRKIKCACGYIIVDNPEKHQTRDKYCPNCKTPYRKAGIQWSLPSITFKSLKKTLQNIFHFFPKITSKKEIYYSCPSCSHAIYSEGDLNTGRIPDKIKQVKELGKEKTVIVSWRTIPRCPKCETYMTRRRIDKD